MRTTGRAPRSIAARRSVHEAPGTFNRSRSSLRADRPEPSVADRQVEHPRVGVVAHDRGGTGRPHRAPQDVAQDHGLAGLETSHAQPRRSANATFVASSKASARSGARHVVAQRLGDFEASFNADALISTFASRRRRRRQRQRGAQPRPRPPSRSRCSIVSRASSISAAASRAISSGTRAALLVPALDRLANGRPSLRRVLRHLERGHHAVERGGVDVGELEERRARVLGRVEDPAIALLDVLVAGFADREVAHHRDERRTRRADEGRDRAATRGRRVGRQLVEEPLDRLRRDGVSHRFAPRSRAAPGSARPRRTPRVVGARRRRRRARPEARGRRSRTRAPRIPRSAPSASTASNAVRGPVTSKSTRFIDTVTHAAFGDREPDRSDRRQAAARLADQRRDLLRCLLGPGQVQVERHERLAGADRGRPGAPDLVRPEVGQALAPRDRFAQALELASAHVGQVRALGRQCRAVVQVDRETERLGELLREHRGRARRPRPSRSPGAARTGSRRRRPSADARPHAASCRSARRPSRRRPWRCGEPRRDRRRRSCRAGGARRRPADTRGGSRARSRAHRRSRR